MSRARYFVNRLKDFKEGSEVVLTTSKWKEMSESLAKTISEKMAPNLDNCDGGLYVGNAGVAYMFWYLASCAAFDDKRKHLLEQAFEYFGVSLKYASGKSNRDSGTSFILGTSGVYAVGSLIAKSMGNEKLCGEYATKYASYAKEVQKLNFLSCGSDELFVGRAGYLCGVLNLHKKLGEKVLSDADVNAICSAVVESGRQYARRHRSGSPLMYAYYNTEYLGAAHGLSSILQMLLSFPQFVLSNPDAERDIRQAVDFMLSLEQPNFNFPPAMDEVQRRSRSDSDELVHWCHGAPGIIYLFVRAFKVWGDEKYLQACVRCGEVTWQRGLLRKGPGICHGVAGSGYVFLLLYRLTGHKKYLHRAQQFAEFLFTPEFQSGARVPDSPYSLYEGWAGTVCFLADLTQPESAEFPLFDVF
ncbi:lanC-like protein 3 [Haliotis cracherodii]|uniref:lanC-like protein 3 n=1 Tax=Haliotis cracherodii TaxID=6455 RepID=UPI0039EC1C36